MTSKLFRKLAKPFLISQVAVTGSLFTGDLICQYITYDPITSVTEEEIDTKPSRPLSWSSRSSLIANMPSSWKLPIWWNTERSAVMIATALLVSGPYGFTQMRIIDHFLPGRSAKDILKKVAINGLQAPVAISMAFASISLFSGKSISEAKIKISNDLGRTWMSGACYWPFVSMLTFRFVPIDFRPMSNSVAGSMWNIYLSMMAHKSGNGESNYISVVDPVSGAGTIIPNPHIHSLQPTTE